MLYLFQKTVFLFYAFWFTFQVFFKLWNGWKKNILELTMWNSCPQTLKKETCSEKSKNNTKQTYWFSSLCWIARNQYRWQQLTKSHQTHREQRARGKNHARGTPGTAPARPCNPTERAASPAPCHLPRKDEARRFGRAQPHIFTKSIRFQIILILWIPHE